MNTKLKQTEIGEFPEEWGIEKLDKITNIYDSLHQTPKYSRKGFSMIRVTDIKGGNLDLKDTLKVSEEIYKIFTAKYIPTKGDIVISRVGSYGVFGYVNSTEPFCLGQNTAIIHPKINSQYLYSFLSSNLARLQIESFVVGSTQKTLSLQNIKNILVSIPDVDTISEIASILSSFDDKIELNRKMNKTLEEMAKALFKNWFIDFEFPNEEGKPYKSSGGEMVESELGMIPKGWVISQLNDFIEVNRGLSYKGKHLKDSGIPMINLGNFGQNNQFLEDKLKYYDGPYKVASTVKIEDIVIANTDITQNRVVLGSSFIVPSRLRNEIILFTHHVYGVKNKGKLSNDFIQSIFSTKSFKNSAIAYATGTTVLFLPKNAITDYLFCVPPQNIMAMYAEMNKRWRSMIDNNFQEINTLMVIRNSLLPKLMSGSIRTI